MHGGLAGSSADAMERGQRQPTLGKKKGGRGEEKGEKNMSRELAKVGEREMCFEEKSRKDAMLSSCPTCHSVPHLCLEGHQL